MSITIDPADRATRIEDEARGFAAWCREYTGHIVDHNGTSIGSDFFQFLAQLEAALDLPPPEPGSAPRTDLQCYEVGESCSSPPAGSTVCSSCGWGTLASGD